MSENRPNNSSKPLCRQSRLGGRKGTSGNPRGRPKEQDCLTQLLREEIQKICPADREKRKWKELIVRATLQLAMKGNATALKEVWERLDGKVLQTEKLQLGGADGKQVTIEVVYADQPKESTTSKTREE